MGSIRDWLTRITSPGHSKEAHELRYWRSRKAIEGTLSNEHYEHFHTRHFGLSAEDYAGRRVLDIGCGPRGSLEWMIAAAERVGLDPLAKQYLGLGAARHQMTYVEGFSEAIPYPDARFDIVCSFNSLDHVADLGKTVAEVIRVTRPGGLFLLLTEVNHDPTPCEPLSFSWDVLELFRPGFEIEDQRHFEKVAPGIYDSLRAAVPYEHANAARRMGILSARLRRII